MSAAGSPIKPGKGRIIPTRRVMINDPSQLPHDYSSTPGGTIFSTTPGGQVHGEFPPSTHHADFYKYCDSLKKCTKLIYDRAFLMQCRNSPLTRSPPANMANIPGVTSPGEVEMPKENGVDQPKKDVAEKPAAPAGGGGDEPSQFQMDI